MLYKKAYYKIILSLILIIQFLFFNIYTAFATESSAVSADVIYGDINCDKAIDITDVSLLQKYISQLEVISDEQLARADVDESGIIDIKDATLIQKYIVQLITVFPADIPEITFADIADGSYYLKLKNTELYLSHQSGISNGTNVFVSEFSESSYSDFIVNIEHSDTDSYILDSPLNENILIGGFRNGGYSSVLSAGKNVNLWENTDIKAQQWKISKCKDGCFIFTLASDCDLSLGVDGVNTVLVEYNNTDALQKWELIPAQDYQKPEFPATVLGDLNVRSGPDTSYPSIGVLSKDENIVIIGDLHGNWYEVRGKNSITGNTITGYSHKNYISTSAEIEKQGRALVNVNVRSGAGTQYGSLGVFAKGIQLKIIGEASGNWYKVRGAVSSDGKVVTGYSHKDYISIDENFVDTDNKKPDFSSSAYNNSVSPFAYSNLYGQCTWYAWGRAKEVTGKNVPCRGNAKTWYSVASNAGYSVGSEPKKNSIAVWSSDNYGHVAYVEKVTDDYVTISESNWYRTTLDNQYSIESGIYYYSGFTTLTTSQISNRYGTFLGYIYL